MHARDRAQTTFRCTHGERSVGKDDEPHAVIVGRRHLRKACRDIGVQAIAIQKPGAHPAEASRIHRDENVEMLILAELACYQRARARRRLPVDACERVARCIGAQLIELRARTQSPPCP